ncbi:MAG: PDZ domain-containing protein [Planctomycetes bacterium]|nr:PDZ domain-containing protein [Planctomycetota bacterium]
MKLHRLLLSLALAVSACSTDELARQAPPLVRMEEPLELLTEPDDEAARAALAPGVFTGLTVGDARASLDAMLVEPEGVVVLSIVENSPAQAAGLEVGDIVLEVRGRESVALHWPSEWRRIELEAEAGAKLLLTIDRAGTESELELVPQARLRPATRERGERFREEQRVGVVLRTATEVEARAAALGPGAGAVVVGLTRESPWRSAGLVYGDLIRAVDGDEVAHPSTVLEAIRAQPEDGALELEVVRAGSLVSVHAPLSRRAQELTELSIPILFSYEKSRDRSATSLLLGLFRYESTPAAWRLRILWLFALSGGDADRLESVER